MSDNQSSNVQVVLTKGPTGIQFFPEGKLIIYHQGISHEITFGFAIRGLEIGETACIIRGELPRALFSPVMRELVYMSIVIAGTTFLYPFVDFETQVDKSLGIEISQ